jgi:hypothetical protein
VTAWISPEFHVAEVPGKNREGRQCVRLLQPVIYRDGPIEIIAPMGFETDFASVPGFLDGIVPSFGPWARAAIIHDFAYHVGGNLPSGRITRKQADEAFKKALRLCGVPGWRREIMFQAVRAGGSSGWGKSS